MKTSLTKTVVAAVIVAFLATLAPLPAATAAQQIGVADYKKILENSYVYGELLDRLNQEMEVAKINLGKQLMNERNAVRKRQLTQQFEENYTRRRNELIRPLFAEVKAAVVEVAHEYGLSRVEDSATGARGVDVTEAVIAKLNSKTPNLASSAPVAPVYANTPVQNNRQPQQIQQPAQQVQEVQQEQAVQQPSGKLSKKERKAAAKAAKAQRKAAKKAAKEQAKQERQAALAAEKQAAKEENPDTQAATAEDAAITQAKANADNLLAELSRPKAAAAPKQPLFTPQPAVGNVPAQRSFTSSEEGRRYVAPSVNVSGNEVTLGEETKQELPKTKATRKTAKQDSNEVVKAVRPKRTPKVADIPAKAEPNSAAEAAGLQRKATRATKNVKAAPAQYSGKAKGNIEVQFGADYDKPDITRMVNLAKKNGIANAYVLETTSQKTGKLFWRARVPAANKAEAQALSRKLSAIGLSNYITDAR